MDTAIVTRRDFLDDRQGRTFADVLNDPEQPFAEVLAFFNNEARQRRMEESEVHHNRPPLAGVVRELESQPRVHRFLCSLHPRRTKRLRQAVGVVVRMIMERRGWKKTGKKGSLGVRRAAPGEAPQGPCHNSGGLSLWFLRAERYDPLRGAKFPSVPDRVRQLGRTGRRTAARTRRGAAAKSRRADSAKRRAGNGSTAP